MALFFRRPLALFCVVFTLSLLFFSHTDSAAKIVFAVLSFLLFLLLMLISNSSRLKTVYPKSETVT